MEPIRKTIESALEYLLAPAGLVGESGVLLFANQALANLAKIPKSQAQGKPLSALLKSEGEDLAELLSKARASKTPLSSGAFELVTGDKSRVILSRFIALTDNILLISFQDLYREPAATPVSLPAPPAAPTSIPLPEALTPAVPTPNMPPPPPADSERWRREAKQWEDRYNKIAEQLTEQSNALQQAQSEAKMSQMAATQMAMQAPSSQIEAAQVLKYLGNCLQAVEPLARLRQYLKDCLLLVTKLRHIKGTESPDRFSLIQLNIATLKGFTDELGAEFLTPLIIGIEANMKARRQNLKNDLQFFDALENDLGRLEEIARAMQHICGGDLAKGSDDPLIHWQEYVANFRSELLQHCHEIGKPVSLIFKSTHALTGKDLDLFDRLTKTLISRSVNQGIEPPTMRLAAGKKENGHVLVNIERRGSYYIVQVADDGSGIGLEALYRKGIEWGVLEKKDVPMDPDKIVEFLLTPKIFAEAGSRLTHLPAVKSEVEAHGGFLRLERSSDKKGTKFIFDWLVLEQSEHPLDDSSAA